jgi:hypothetical protein
LLRFGPHAPWLAHYGLLPHIRDVPKWFASDVALVALGLPAILELVAERFPEARVILDQVHVYLNECIAATTCLSVLDATERPVVG